MRNDNLREAERIAWLQAAPVLTPENVPQLIGRNAARISGCQLEAFIQEHAREIYKQEREERRWRSTRMRAA